jgi:putative tricarboxylic transport membrane protein
MLRQQMLRQLANGLVNSGLLRKALLRNTIRCTLHGIAAALTLGLFASAVSAQSDYPRRPITLIVPFAAGGPTDVIARIASEHMSRTLGQQLIVENVVGAGGTTASTRAMRAAPDGYTIIMGHMGTHAASVALYPNLAYKPDVDFAPIGLVAGTPVLILARKDFPPKDLKEFVPYVKANVDKLNMAHAGVGSVSFTTCLLLNHILNVKPTSVPYNGTGPALTALIAGQVDYMCDQIVNVVQQISAGQIKAYAIGTPARSPALPDVPTAKEAGLPEFEAQAWNALFAPKNTPKPILDTLSAALDKALDDEGTRKRLLELGSVLPDKNGRTQQALQNLVKSEIARWTPIIQAAGPN